MNRTDTIKRGQLIEYKVVNFIDCVTSCPNKPSKEAGLEKIPVGSNACGMCKHHVYNHMPMKTLMDEREETGYGYVVCFYREDKGLDTKRSDIFIPAV